MMFASILFPQTEKSPVLDIQKLIKIFEKPAFEKSKSFLTLPSTVRLTSVRGGNEGGGKHDVCINIISTD